MQISKFRVLLSFIAALGAGAAVMILLRIWLYGDSNLPHWLTRSYVSYGRFSPEPRTSTVLADAISVAVLALMVIEAFWVRQKLSPESEQTTA